MSKTKAWYVVVPPNLNEAVDKAVMEDFHKTKAEFIRSAVREKLARMGVESKLGVEKMQ